MGTRFILVAFLLAAGCAVKPAPSAPRELPTQPFRDEHREIKEHLSHVSAWVSQLASAPPARQRELMRQTLAFLKDHLVAHAEWEDKFLYPAVDRRTSNPDYPFTSTMRYEHRIVGRWIGELEAMAAKEPPDVVSFVRRGFNLLGLISAHFEEEEEVLLPILDRTMTAEEFRREFGSSP